MLSNGYQDIHLFRFDEKTGHIFILAGNDLQIIIPSKVEWYSILLGIPDLVITFFYQEFSGEEIKATST